MRPTLEEVAGLGNLYLAAREARRHKRRFPYVREFEADLETNLLAIREELQAGTYRPGEFETFWIEEPKRRLISAAPYRDRVVHHAVVRVLEPIWERRFIHHTYACRRGKGSHAALDACQRFARRHPYVLHADVRKYFPTVDHGVLERVLFRHVPEPGLRSLLSVLIRHTGPLEPVTAWFPGDDLFTPLARTKGLPIGNLTSQFFANALLDRLDHFVTDELGFGACVRYMDDVAVFGDTLAELAWVRDRIDAFLEGLRLRLHPGKRSIQRTCDGLRFLGFRVFPDHLRVTYEGKRRQVDRLARLRAAFARDEVGLDSLRSSVASMGGHLAQGNTYYLRKARRRLETFSKEHTAGGRERRSVVRRTATTTNRGTSTTTTVFGCRRAALPRPGPRASTDTRAVPRASPWAPLLVPLRLARRWGTKRERVRSAHGRGPGPLGEGDPP